MEGPTTLDYYILLEVIQLYRRPRGRVFGEDYCLTF